MEIKKASDGRANLHIYREGDEYFRQKSKIFLTEFTTVIYNVEPPPPDSPMLYWDLAQPLPFADRSFDAVDCYHVYEHLFREEADRFTGEVHRVLKPGGIYRVSVPDLEWIAGEYLKYLEAALQDPSATNVKRYRWTVMKLIEQSIREKTGGLMLEAIRRGEFDRAYVREHYGEAFDAFFRGPSERPQPATAEVSRKKTLRQRLFSLTPQKVSRKIRWLDYERKLAEFKRGRGKDLRFNRETVSLLPDRLYLKLLLAKPGFTGFSIKDYKTSDIPNWAKYDLDRSNNGDYPFDPSLYVEVRKGGVADGRSSQ